MKKYCRFLSLVSVFIFAAVFSACSNTSDIENAPVDITVGSFSLYLPDNSNSHEDETEPILEEEESDVIFSSWIEASRANGVDLSLLYFDSHSVVYTDDLSDEYDVYQSYFDLEATSRISDSSKSPEERIMVSSQSPQIYLATVFSGKDHLAEDGELLGYYESFYSLCGDYGYDTLETVDIDGTDLTVTFFKSKSDTAYDESTGAVIRVIDRHLIARTIHKNSLYVLDFGIIDDLNDTYVQNAVDGICALLAGYAK